MNASLKIAIAHDDLDTLVSLHASVCEIGHDVCVDAISGQQLIESAGEQSPDLLIVKEELRDMRGWKAASDAWKGEPIPAIVLVDRSDGELGNCPESTNVLAVLAEPVRQADLVPAVPLVMQRFRQLQHLRKDINELTKELESGYRPISPTENGASQLGL